MKKVVFEQQSAIGSNSLIYALVLNLLKDIPERISSFYLCFKKKKRKDEDRSKISFNKFRTSARNKYWPASVSLITFSFLLVTIISANENKDEYTIKVLTQEKMKAVLPFVAQARLTTFCHYPYLYEGDFDDEMNDLDKYAENSQSALAIAYHQDIPVGFLCGSDFMHYSPMFENPIADTFKEEGLDPEKHYYFADVILLPEHRGKRLSPKLFKKLEKHAEKQGYQFTCFVTEHHYNHPLKPDNHRSLVPLWNKLGYHKSSILGYASWPTYQEDGTVKKQQHPLVFWFKNLGK